MKNLLIIGAVWPEPQSSAAGSHMMQLIDSFKSINYDITFATACSKTENAVALETIEIKEKEIQLNDVSFDTFIEELDPNIVIYDRFITEEQFGWRVSEKCPNALKILNTEDLHGLRQGRHLALKDKRPFQDNDLFNDVAKREVASIYRCDLSLIISEAEMELLLTKFKVDASLLHYFPFLLEEIKNEVISKLPKYDEREHFVTIGNFLHAPNSDAVTYLKNEIWPAIRKELPQAEMHIYGAYMPEKTKQLHDVPNGFMVKGFAQEVNKVMSYSRVCLAPLRFGAGLKGKLIDAMRNGTPCITTTIGAEGLFGSLKPNGFVTNDAKELSRKAIELYTNKKIWKEKQKNGFEVVNKRFSKNQLKMDLLNKIEILQENLNQHRLQNFTGAMLHHHMLQSTKFMSKWIEEKNKSR